MRLLLPLLIPVCAFAQQAQNTGSQTCFLSGRIENSVTGAPVRKAAVRLRPVDPKPKNLANTQEGDAEDPLETATNAEGAFSFSGLAAGSYRLFAERTGFSPTFWGAKRHAKTGQPLQLAAGDRREDIAIRLVPLSAITGKVVEEDGDPVPNAQVQLLVPVYMPSGREMKVQNGTYTNDLGEYRIHSLTPRRYFLRVDPPRSEMTSGKVGRGKRKSLVGAFYPGVAEPSGAAALELEAGQQLNGVDITLHMGHRVTVNGRLVLPPGATRLQVTAGQYSDSGSSTTTVDLSDPAGHFSWSNLAPGDYLLDGRCSVGDQEYHAYLPFTLGSTDVENLELRPAPPVEVTGHVRFEGPVNEKVVSASLLLNGKLSRSHLTAKIQKDGKFTVSRLGPDVYRLALNSGAEAFITEARWGSIDALNSGLDLSPGSSASDVSVVISSDVATLEGTVQNDKQEPLATGLVVLRATPTNGESYLNSNFNAVKVDRSGKFSIAGIAPGHYRILAWEDVDEGTARYDPMFFRQMMAQGQALDIVAGERKSIIVQVVAEPDEQK